MTLVANPKIPEGTTFGQSTTDKISFYGVTPIVQPSGATMVSLPTTTPTQTSPFGYSTSAALNEITDLIREIRATLVELGLHAGA